MLLGKVFGISELSQLRFGILVDVSALVQISRCGNRRYSADSTSGLALARAWRGSGSSAIVFPIYMGTPTP